MHRNSRQPITEVVNHPDIDLVEIKLENTSINGKPPVEKTLKIAKKNRKQKKEESKDDAQHKGRDECESDCESDENKEQVDLEDGAVAKADEDKK